MQQYTCVIRHKYIVPIVTLSVALLLLSACGQQPGMLPASYNVVTPTTPPTSTSASTATPLPTDTPASTATPLPTNTLVPTDTPASEENDTQDDQEDTSDQDQSETDTETDTNTDVLDIGDGLTLTAVNNATEEPSFTIETRVPLLSGSDSDEVNTFNLTVDELVSNEVITFMQEYAAEADELDMPAPYSFWTDYTVTLATSKLISIRFQFSYFTGGAHPNHYTLPLTYDLTTGTILALDDLFQPESDYLERLEEYCINELQAILEYSDPDWINDGAAATPENYKTWNITPDGLLISFDPYQVAAYATGMQTVDIPATELADILIPGIIPDSDQARTNQNQQSHTGPSATADGPVRIRGVYTYTNDLFIEQAFVQNHAVMLTDIHGFVVRDPEWEVPVESQVLGYLDVDPDAHMGSYILHLPNQPAGQFNDVNPNGHDEQGVQIYSVEYAPTIADGPFYVGNDPVYGWPASDSSVTIDTDPQNYGEITGGTLIVWAADDAQLFPSGFGKDGLLFTDDDPVAPLEAGYSVVDLDQMPFALIRDSEPNVTVREIADVSIKDYSDTSYSEAFQQLVDVLRDNYAFPEKAPDWDAVVPPLLERIEQAEDGEDIIALCEALYDFTAAFNDGHVATLCNLDQRHTSSLEELEKLFPLGGYGFAIRELDDGSVVVVYVLENSPADEAGMLVGDDVVLFNDQPITETIRTAPLTIGNSFSTPIPRRLMQEKMALRAPIGTPATVSFTTPNTDAVQTATLTSVLELSSFFHTDNSMQETPLLPVTFEITDDGTGYINVSSNLDDIVLTYRLFERALHVFEEELVSGIIIDMRYNTGGLMLGLAGFFSDEELELGQTAYYSKQTGTFETPLYSIPTRAIPWTRQYDFGAIAVLIGPDCDSACEGEAYLFNQLPNVITLGHAPTAGMFGEVSRGQFVLADGVEFQAPFGRSVHADGSLLIEGMGITPTIRVAVDRDAVLGEEDVVIRAAEEAIRSTLLAAGDASMPSPAMPPSFAPGEDIVSEGGSFRLDGQEGWQAFVMDETDSGVVTLVPEGSDINSLPFIRLGVGPQSDMLFEEIAADASIDDILDTLDINEDEIVSERADIEIDGITGRMLDIQTDGGIVGELRIRIVLARLPDERLCMIQMVAPVDEWDTTMFDHVVQSIQFIAEAETNANADAKTDAEAETEDEDVSEDEDVTEE